MVLIIYIALGIVLAVVILNYLPEILALALILLGGAIALTAVVGAGVFIYSLMPSKTVPQQSVRTAPAVIRPPAPVSVPSEPLPQLAAPVLPAKDLFQENVQPPQTVKEVVNNSRGYTITGTKEASVYQDILSGKFKDDGRSAAVSGTKSRCVYKSVMTDEELARCR